MLNVQTNQKIETVESSLNKKIDNMHYEISNKYDNLQSSISRLSNRQQCKTREIPISGKMAKS